MFTLYGSTYLILGDFCIPDMDGRESESVDVERERKDNKQQQQQGAENGKQSEAVGVDQQ